MSRESEIKDVEKLMMEEAKDKKRFRKLKEVTLAEDFAAMNTNEASRWNAGNPKVGALLHENSPRWARIFYSLIFLYVIVVAVSLFLMVLNGIL